MVRRIHVIGGPGSGKTTLARRLGSELHIAPTDLDEFAYASGAKRPLATRIADVSELAAQPEWISEGIYLWWIDELLRSADAIVWLDVPWRVAAWRIVLRHVRASVAGTNRHAGLGRLFRFVRSTRRYSVDATLRQPSTPDDDGAVTRAHTARELAAYGQKVVRCSTSVQIERFVNSLL